MPSQKKVVILILSALVMIALLTSIDSVLSKAESPELSKVVFYVS